MTSTDLIALAIDNPPQQSPSTSFFSSSFCCSETVTPASEELDSVNPCPHSYSTTASYCFPSAPLSSDPFARSASSWRWAAASNYARWPYFVNCRHRIQENFVSLCSEMIDCWRSWMWLDRRRLRQHWVCRRFALWTGLIRFRLGPCLTKVGSLLWWGQQSSSSGDCSFPWWLGSVATPSPVNTATGLRRAWSPCCCLRIVVVCCHYHRRWTWNSLVLFYIC